MKETLHCLQGRENKHSYPPKQEKKEKTRCLCTKKKKNAKDIEGSYIIYDH